jgi:IS5 family transposase
MLAAFLVPAEIGVVGVARLRRYPALTGFDADGFRDGHPRVSEKAPCGRAWSTARRRRCSWRAPSLASCSALLWGRRRWRGPRRRTTRWCGWAHCRSGVDPVVAANLLRLVPEAAVLDRLALGMIT